MNHTDKSCLKVKMHGFHNCLTVYRWKKIGTYNSECLPEKRDRLWQERPSSTVVLCLPKCVFWSFKETNEQVNHQKRSLRLDWCPSSFITYYDISCVRVKPSKCTVWMAVVSSVQIETKQLPTSYMLCYQHHV